MAATELQAVAHGADTVQFFQLKQALGGSEKFHGAVISHANRTDTRAFKEVAKLGHDLRKVGPVIKNSQTKARVALIFDWSNFWAFEYVDGITQDLKYVPIILDYYRQFYELNIPTDVISVDDDFSQYDLVVAPVLYMVKDGLGKKITDYVANGGNFITSFMSGMVNESDNIYPGGYPGPLKEVMGLWVEESDAILPDKDVKLAMTTGDELTGHLIADLIRLNGAHVLAKYASEFYAGTPAVTENTYSKGKAWYVGSRLDHVSLRKIIMHIVDDVHLSALVKEPTELEITKRQNSAGQDIYFVLNMGKGKQPLPVEFQKGYRDLLTDTSPETMLDSWDVEILVQK